MERPSYLLFAFLVIAVLAAGIPLIFFVEFNETPQLLYIGDIRARQDILIGNVTDELVQVQDLQNDLVILENIIIYEEAQIPIISRLIDDIECIGVKLINGITPDPVNRTFYMAGAEGIEIVEQVPDTIIVNATGLNTQYQSEQQSITTLFDMSLMTQNAIAILDMEVLKSLNLFVPPLNTSNIDIFGICGTSVYPISNGTVAVDMCGLASNATAAFDGIEFDFTQINAQIDELLVNIVILVNQTVNVLADAETLLSNAIFTINNSTTVANNIDIIGGRGISASNGTASNEISLLNTGLIGLNGITTQRNLNIVAGAGISVTTDAAEHKVTVANMFATQPCVASTTSTVAVPSWALATGPFFTTLPQNWGLQVLTPPGCVGTTIFQPALCGAVACGVFIVPQGIWILSVNMVLYSQDGYNIQATFGFVSLSYYIPFNSVGFQRSFPSTSYQFVDYHLELTISSSIYPVGTQFQLQYQLSSSAAVSSIYTTQFNMTRIA